MYMNLTIEMQSSVRQEKVALHCVHLKKNNNRHAIKHCPIHDFTRVIYLFDKYWQCEQVFSFANIATLCRHIETLTLQMFFFTSNDLHVYCRTNSFAEVMPLFKNEYTCILVGSVSSNFL